MLSKVGAVAGTQAGSCQYPGVRWAHRLSARKEYLNEEEKERQNRFRRGWPIWWQNCVSFVLTNCSFLT